MTAQQIVEALGLEPLEGEGGMVAVTYRCKETVGEAPLMGGIYYLLHGKAFSHFHQLTADEVWMFHTGDSVELVTLWPDGTHKVTRLGNDISKGEAPQYTVPAGVWMGARLSAGGDHALMSTVTAPGYTEGCYTHGCREDLLARWPQARAEIEALTGAAVYF